MSDSASARIRLSCTNCGVAMKVPAKAAGRAVRCPKCQQTLRVPTAGGAHESASATGGVSPAGAAAPTADRITVPCEGCGKQLHVPATAVGKRIKCPSCATAFTIAAPPPPPADSASSDDLLGEDDNPLGEEDVFGGDDDLLSGLAGGEAVDLPPDAAAAPPADASPKCPKCGAGMFLGAMVCPSCGHDQTPKTKSRSRVGSGFSMPSLNFDFTVIFRRRIARLWMGAIFFGGALIFMAVREARLNAVAQLEPQDITCGKLTADGPGDNAHVNMTDFVLCDGVVYEYDENGDWNKAWVPAVPIGSPYHRQRLEATDNKGNLTEEIPLPSDFKVIVELPGASGFDYIDRISRKDVIHGTIVNVIQKLDDETKKLLRQDYGVNPDDCWILVEGRTPGGTDRVWNYAGGGVVLMIFGGIMLLRMASMGG